MRHNIQQASPLDAISWFAWESDEPESNWLLTYVDMLSVLLAMLVVLLGHMAVQQMQQPQSDSVIAPVANVIETTQTQVSRQFEETRVISEPSASLPEPMPTPIPEVAAQVDIEQTAEQPQMPSPESNLEVAIEPTAEQPQIPSSESRLEAAIEADFQGAVKMIRRDHGISLEIADVILFESNKETLRPQAGEVLSRLAVTLQAIGESEIAVEGHTDDQPIRGGRFLSNWELAAARANAVTQYLIAQGFAPARLRSVSYADTRPVADNRTAEGRAENRRVSLRVEFL
jgi:chemotaxis protein MotB